MVEILPPTSHRLGWTATPLFTCPMTGSRPAGATPLLYMFDGHNLF